MTEEEQKELNEKLFDALDRDECLSTICHLLKSGADANARDDNGATPLHTAASGNNPEHLKALLDAGADVNAAEPKYGVTPLVCAIMDERTKNVRLLLDAGADVNVSDVDKWTPLHTAAKCCRDDERIIEMLLEAGANINAKSEDGATPFHIALINLNFPNIRALLKAKCDTHINVSDNDIHLMETVFTALTEEDTCEDEDIPHPRDFLSSLMDE